jgi:hypothetical protein
MRMWTRRRTSVSFNNSSLRIGHTSSQWTTFELAAQKLSARSKKSAQALEAVHKLHNSLPVPGQRAASRLCPRFPLCIFNRLATTPALPVSERVLDLLPQEASGHSTLEQVPTQAHSKPVRRRR